MDPLFKKLNVKDHKEILVLQAPDSFQGPMDRMKSLTTFLIDLKDIKQLKFALVFVTQQSEIDTFVPLIDEKIEGDAIIWFCYPKKYTCNFNKGYLIS